MKRQNANDMSASSGWLRRAQHGFDITVVFISASLPLLLVPSISVTDNGYFLLILTASLLFPVVGELLGLYQPWRGRNFYAMLGAYIGVWASVLIILSLLLTVMQSDSVKPQRWMILAALSVVVIGISLRACIYACLRHLRARGHNLKRILVVGQADNVELITQRLSNTHHAGYVVTQHCIDCRSPRFLVRMRYLARESVFKRDFNEIWLGYSLAEGERVRQLMAIFSAVPVTVRFFPELPDIRLLNHRITQVTGLYSLTLNDTPLSGSMRVLKALEDRLLGTTLFICFFPLMIVIALLIRWQMGGPVLFKQYRHGLDGKQFKIYKFRTMALHNSRKTQQAFRSDPRITPLGAFLRRTSLDELPQLYNVLQGRMSLVGPRPHALDHNDHYKDHIEHYMQRHRVKPGMTGWAQVNGWRGNTETLHDMQQRVEYDFYYIDNWSLAFDIKILAMTLTRGFFNKQP